MTVTYVAEAIQEVKRALIENQLGKVSEYANSRTHRNAVYIVINQNFMIDKLAQIDNDEIREELIGTSKAMSHYYDWARTGSYRVKCKLIEHLHYLDVLIKDDNPSIRLNVARKQPRYLKQLLGKTPMELNYVCECVSVSKHIDEELLDGLLKALSEEHDPELYKALTLKQKAMSHTPTTVEKTMTPEQLRRIGSPLWALTMSPIEIINELASN